MTVKVLVVDDDPPIRRMLGTALRRTGHDVVEAQDAASALAVAKAERPDIVLLDLGLPDRDGMEIITLLKANGDAAVLIVSARDATGEKVAALDLGADDYVTKPFDTDELLARLRTAARHRVSRPFDRVELDNGAIEIDFGTRTVLRDGDMVHLTPKEFALLHELAREPGRIVTHSHLLKAVWGAAHGHDIDYLRVAIRSLRLKLEADPAQPRIIINDPGIGYRAI